MIALLSPVPASVRVSDHWQRVATEKHRAHNGVDFACAKGTPLRAPSNGRVSFAGPLESSPGSGIALGVRAVVDGHDVFWSFAHLSAALKPPGSTVQRGEVVALSGNTGGVRGRRRDGSIGPPTEAEPNVGAHLHFRVDIDGVNVDPLPLLVNASGSPILGLVLAAAAYGVLV